MKGYKTNPQPARSAVAAESPAPTATSTSDLPLNEVGIMAVMEARRQGEADKS